VFIDGLAVVVVSSNSKAVFITRSLLHV